MPAAPRAKKVPGDGQASAGQDGAFDGASDSDSDSGESLFLTQHDAPEAGRSRSRKVPTAGDRSSLHSSTKAKLERTLRFNLPKYSFNIPKHSPSSLTLTLQQNIEMHSAVIRGFFTSVRDLGAGDLPSPRPTVDLEGDSIAPVSDREETEDETVADEHIRIVQKKCLVVSSKPKCGRPWYDPQRTGGWVRPLCYKGPEASRGGPHQAPDAGSSQRESPRRVLGNTPASRGALLLQTEASKAKKNKVFEQEEKADGSSSDSDATFCEELEEHAQKLRQASPGRALLHTDVSLTNTLSRRQEGASAPKHQSDLVDSESRGVKKNNRHRLDSESTEEELFPSQEEEEIRRVQPVLVDDTPDVPPSLGEEDSLLHSYAQNQGDALISKREENRRRLNSESTEENLFQSQEELHSGPSLFVDETPDLISPSVDEVDIVPLGDAKNEGDVHDSKQQNVKKKNKRRGDGASTEDETSPSHEALRDGQSGHVDEPPDLLAPISEEDTFSHCGAEGEGDMPESRQRIKKKKKKKKKNRQGDAQEKEDMPKSKKKKKKTKKRSRADDDITEKVDGHVEFDVRVEASFSSSCCTEEGGKKKKKRKRRDEEALQVQSDKGAELHEKMRPSNATSDQTSMEQIDESKDCLEPSEAALEVLESPSGTRQRKKRKKHSSVCEANLQGGEDGGEVSSSFKGISLVESLELPVKKKKKRRSVNGGMTLTPQEENTQITAEGAKEQDTKLQAKKKKKKKQQTLGAPSLSISLDTVEQSDDSVSLRKKKERSSTSFLAADAEQPASGSAAVGGSLMVRDEVRRKKKKKKKKEASECAADADFSLTEEDAAVRKRKKKPGAEVEPAESERVESASPDPWSLPTPRKRGATVAANSGSNASLMESFSPCSLVDQDELRAERKKKKKMTDALPEDQSFSSDTGAAHKKKAACGDSSHADGHRNPKRTLYNPHTDFLLW